MLEKVTTPAEIAGKYGLHPNAVYQALLRGALVEGRDCRQSGKTWLILASAAERLWGHRLITVPEGYRLCRKCGGIFPANVFHFKPYKFTNTGQEGLSNKCRDCLNTLEAARFQRVKAARRPRHTAYMRQYRADNPGYNARAVQRHQQRRRQRENEVQS